MNVNPILAFIALGSNLGDRRAHLDAALDAIARLPTTRIIARSSYMQTPPVGPVAQGDFLNAAVSVRTALSPRELLDALHAIERSRARDRARAPRWGPRTLDLDLLLHGPSIINEPGLTLPHPRMHERAFVLAPLAQIAPDLAIPTLGRTVRELLEALPAPGPAIA